MGVATRWVRHQGPSGGGPVWGGVALGVAVAVAGPLLVLPLSFLHRADTWEVAARLLPTAVSRSALLGVGVAAGTLLLGTSLAVLLSFYEFPGRRVLAWAVVLPLGMPAYIFTFVLLGQYDSANALRRAATAATGVEVALPEIRSTGGAVAVLTLVLYPYVYLLARTAFVTGSPRLLEAGRTLGLSHLGAIRRVALPLARPALAAGTSLAVMEALADFGTVNLLGYRALPDAIYRLWYGAFDRRAALQLGAVLLGLVALMATVERLSRRRSVAQPAGGAAAIARRRLRGWRAWIAALLPTALVAAVVAAPVAQLVLWAVDSVRTGTYDPALVANMRNSIMLALLTAMLTTGGAILVVFSVRLAPTALRRVALRVSTLGYAVPGSVAAAAVFMVANALGGLSGAVLTASLAALVVAYCVRFTTLSLQATEARMAALPSSIDDVARSLGAGPGRLVGEIHLPLLLPAAATGAFLVFVEVLKELPATALLRPFGLDTLPIAIWEATKESLYEAAALPALILLAVSMVPVAYLVRSVGEPPR